MAIKNIEKISEDTRRDLLGKSVYSLPDNPSERGIGANRLKQAFYEAYIGEDGSLFSEINRIVDSINSSFLQCGEKFCAIDETVESKIESVEVEHGADGVNLIVSYGGKENVSTLPLADWLKENLKIKISENENFKYTFSLNSSDGTPVTSADIDLPLEELVVSGAVSDDGKNLELMLRNGASIEISVAEIIRGLVKHIDEARRVYSTDADGQDGGIPYSDTADGDSMVLRTSYGAVKTAAPIADDDAATKSYADGKVGVHDNANSSFDKVYAVGAKNRVIEPIVISPEYVGVGQALVRRDKYGTFNIPEPRDEENAANKKYVDTLGIRVDENGKRIENLEGLLLSYIEDGSVAYKKTVPVGAASNAILNSCGGNTERCKNRFNPQRLATGPYEITDDGGIKRMVEITSEPHQETYTVTLPKGTWYLSVSGSALMPFVYTYSSGTGSPQTFPITLESESNVDIVLEYGCGLYSTPFYIMLSEDADAEYEPYRVGLFDIPISAVVSKDKSGDVIDEIDIPSAISSLDGYGKKFTYIDFDNKEYVNESATLTLTGEEVIGYYEYVGNHGISIPQVCKTGKIAVPDYVSTDGDKQGAGYGTGAMWCGYNGSQNFHWIGILDILGYFEKDKEYTTEEKYAAVDKFREYITRRYRSGNPVVVVYQTLERTVTDISEYLTDYADFRALRVEGGGSVEFVNDKRMKVPSTITYVKAK